MTGRPRVSVIMPICDDDPKYIEAAFESLYAQTIQNWELIVLDDSTAESTLEVVHRFQRKLGDRMRYEHNGPPLGFVRALNSGLSMARADYIARMDADDMALPKRLEIQADFLDTNREIDIVGSDVVLIDQRGTELSRRVYGHSHSEIVRTCYIRTPFAHPAVMFRRAVVRSIGGYDVSYERAEDYELWLRAVRAAVRLGNIDQVLLKYRVSDQQSVKRGRVHWRYATKAKFRHFDPGRPIQGAVGIAVSSAMWLAPPFLLKLLYCVDARSSHMHY